jgi:hypothetical protein
MTKHNRIIFRNNKNSPKTGPWKIKANKNIKSKEMVTLKK